MCVCVCVYCVSVCVCVYVPISYICAYLQDITINPAVEKEINELQEAHTNMQITHGGLGGYVKPKPRPEPIDQLHKHLNEHNIKLMDVFRKFDAEDSGCVPEANFREAIKVRVQIRNVKQIVQILCLYDMVIYKIILRQFYITIHM